jgi:hypothetical protein
MELKKDVGASVFWSRTGDPLTQEEREKNRENKNNR